MEVNVQDLSEKGERSVSVLFSAAKEVDRDERV